MRLELGGKEFELKPLTLNDWIIAEDMGLDMMKLQKGNVRLRDMRTLCYIVLHRVDPEITEEWIGDKLSLDDMTLFNQIANFIMPKGSGQTETISNT
jgi:hypothetical protein